MRLLAAALLLCAPALAQTEETLNSWPAYKEIPSQGVEGLAAVILDAEALGGSRRDHADLRLYDSAGREVPYVLRILRGLDESEAFGARIFNRSTLGDTTQATLDLGEAPEEHNQIEIDTPGSNFRRAVTVEGSNDGRSWASLARSAWIFRFSAAGRAAEETRADYPASRYRYLRLRVQADRETEAGPPEIRGAAVRRTIRRDGKLEVFHAEGVERSPVRERSRPASAYRIDLGRRIPVEGLVLQTQAGQFARPFRLEALAGDEAAPLTAASGRLVSDASGEITLRFPEAFAQELTLTVVDDRNPPLGILGAQALSAARQLLFEPPPGHAAPLRLYYGNPEADAPRYDLEAAVPRTLETPPPALPLGAEQANPDYLPPAAPLSERAPWLIYLTLAAASLALFVVLRNLMREAVDS